MAEYGKRSDPVGDRKASKSSSEPSELSEYDSGSDVHLDAKTFLAVFAVLLIYFAQLVSLVGAGAVRLSSIPLKDIVELWSDSLRLHSKVKSSLLTLTLRQALSGSQGLPRSSLSPWGRYSHMLPTTGAENGFSFSRLCWAEWGRSSLLELALSKCVLWDSLLLA